MPFLSKVMNLWNNLFRQGQVERDLNDELQAYVEEMAERKIQAGLAPAAAREAALLELGGIERIKDLVRQQHLGLGNRLRPGIILVVALVAFVIGASTAVVVMRWSTPAPFEPAMTAESGKDDSFQTVPVLEGRLVDNATGQPIPNVEVGLRASPSRRYTFTDDTGHFVFSNPPNQFYKLEAGTQSWTVNQTEFGPHSQSSRSESVDFFEFVAPSTVSVISKDGQPLEGEPNTFRVIAADGKPYPPPGREFRRFRYSTSVVELHAENLSPGKEPER